MSVADSVAAAVAAAAKQKDMNKAEKGGGYTPPAAGLTRLRLVAYVETGKKFDERFSKTKERVQIVFELSGPKHPPREVDGKKIPHRITLYENLSLNEKANFYKLFRAMNYDGSATHMAQLVGKEFLGEVVHEKGKDGVVRARLKRDGVYTIRGPFVEDPETGETRKVPAGPQLSESRIFLWEYATKEMWDSLYIEGEYPEETDESGKVIRKGRSKNVFQDEIRGADNFAGSPIAEILEGAALDLGEGEDELAGVGDLEGDTPSDFDDDIPF